MRFSPSKLNHFAVFCLISIVSISFGCNPSRDDQAKRAKFFEYDEIEYYTCDIATENIADVFDNRSKSEIDSLKMEIIIGDMPTSISDTNFIDKLAEAGYKKTRIAASKFEQIDKLFSEKPETDVPVTSCIKVYRDILIFKKGAKVVGIAKICFGCNAHQIHGTTASTQNFGQDGDYKKLEKLLKR